MSNTLDAKQIGDLFGNKSHGYANWLMEQYPNFPRPVATRAPAKGGMPARIWNKKNVLEFKNHIDEQSQAKPSIDNALARHFITRGARIGSYPSLHLAFE